MSPHDNTTSPQQPDRGKSATELGFFGIFAEILGSLLAIIVGVRFLVGDMYIVAIILFVVAAILLADMIRRIVRARNRGRATSR